MTPRDVLGEALAALAAHRLRATLSSIGIVVGVATVVTALAIGEGARAAAIAEIGALGINNVLVRAVDDSSPSAGDDEEPEAPVLSTTDAQTIADTVATLEAVASLRIGRGEVSVGDRSITTTIIGATVSWDRVTHATLSAGRWLQNNDIDERRRVAVLGAGLSRALFGDIDPSGEYVGAAGENYQVVGVLAGTGSGSAAPSTIQRFDIGASIIVPLTAMDLRLGRGDNINLVNEIAVTATRPEDVAGIAEVVERILVDRRHDPSRYELVIPRALLQARLRAQRTFNGVLLGVGGLALLISGIGIMNIMLASVAERTHEIGVRRAFGARRNEVVAQFTVEASLLCVAGGAIGVPVGMLLSAVVAWLAQWPISISPLSVVMSLVLAAAVGLVFGIYPAKVAATLDPVVALRAE